MISSVRIVSPHLAAPAPVPAAPAQPTAPASPAAPVDLPPELTIRVPAPVEPKPQGWRRLVVPVALAASLVGIVGPIVADVQHAAAVTQEVAARTREAATAALLPQIPAARFPSPEEVGSTELGGPQLSPDGRIIALPSRSYRDGLTLVRVDDGRVAGRAEASRGAAFLPDSRLLTWRDDTLFVREGQTGAEQTKIAARVDRLSVAPVGARAAWIDSGLRILDATGAKTEVRTVALPPGIRDLSVAAWSADGTHLVAAGRTDYDGPSHLLVVDARDGHVALRTEADARAQSITLSRDGSRLAIGRASGYDHGRWDGRVRMIDVASGRTLWDRAGFSTVTFAPAGDRVAITGTADQAAYVSVVDAASGREAFEVHGPTTTGYGRSSVTFTPDGGRLLVSGGDVLQAFDASSGAPVWTRRGNGAQLYAASPDGARIAVSEQVGDQNAARNVVTVLDAVDGHAITQHPIDGNNPNAAFSADGRRLLTSSSQGYGSANVAVLDLTRSPLSADSLARAGEEARALVDGMSDGSPRAHEALDAMPLSVLRTLHDHGTRVVVATSEAGVGPVDVAQRWSDPVALRGVAEKAFQRADADYGKQISDLESRLKDARTAAAQKDPGRAATLGAIAPAGFDATLLDGDVQRAASDLWSARETRAAQAWSEIQATTGGRLESAGTTGEGFTSQAARRTTTAVTLEAVARAHGARSEEQIRQFVALTRALNGPRLEQAQQRYYDAVKALYPSDGPARVDEEQRPFQPDQADLVVPSLYYEGGRAISGADRAALQSWRNGAPAAVFERPDGGRTLVLRDAAPADAGAVREVVGRAYAGALSQADPQFYSRSQARWTDLARRNGRWGGDTVAPESLAARAFAAVTGPDHAGFEKENTEAARLAQAMIDAAR